MWLKNLELLNFRNFSSVKLEFSPTLNIFEGGNSEGKTNLLEAIYCLGRGESFRTFNEKHLIRWNQSHLYVRGEGNRRNNFFKYEFLIGDNLAKVRKVNSRPVSLKNTDWWLWTVVFSSQDVKIVQGSPIYRRKFIDSILSFLYPGFSNLRSSFREVLRQRNTLLRMIEKREENKINKELEVWNFQFLKLGSKIVYLRLKGLKKLSSHFQRILYRLTGKKCPSSLLYSSSFLDPEDTDYSLAKIQEKFFLKLKRIKKREIERKISLIGPHRDDFQIIVDGVNQRIFGSQGEQRTVAIALKLAETALIEEREKEPPIVLLDDITSDLDPIREKFLLDTVQKIGQIFVTTQNISKFDQDFIKKGLIFHIKSGKVVLK